ncbi:3-keto-disaccharide hydrolase [Sediminicola luteus]|uniref:3-keto-alpha-glucoside-1,2-lyase/3-keto-2-hydroxy-glucal hydratase domain-containing protein n=1 Tax=Sediminicola luteus TaxID=319238 RepID=A0A2A4GCJ0_9FLAO|nr:DUF1080 domain-containing protein [Sediminicola luteus]PCE66327.1 hypothetical protein B7P33_03245 [Sediminicola luteus]
MRAVNYVAILFLGLSLSLGCKGEAKKQESQAEEVVTESTEVNTKPDAEWTVLFDGTSFAGWHAYLKAGQPIPDAWSLEEGAMVFDPTKRVGKSDHSYTLISDREYTSFILELEWKLLTPAGNSGFFWSVNEDPAYTEAYMTGAEIQVQDNAVYPTEVHDHRIRKAGAVFGIVPSASEEVVNPIGEWNSYRITIDHSRNQGKVVLNGTDLIEFPVNGPEWKALVDASHFGTWKGFVTSQTGKLGLQDHGTPVAYRNVRIKEIR